MFGHIARRGGICIVVQIARRVFIYAPRPPAPIYLEPLSSSRHSIDFVTFCTNVTALIAFHLSILNQDVLIMFLGDKTRRAAG